MSTHTATDDEFIALLATAMNDPNDDVTCEIETAINSDKTEEVCTYHMIVCVFVLRYILLTTYLFIRAFRQKV